MRLVHKTTYIFCVIFLMTSYAFAQKDTVKVNKLDEVNLYATKQSKKEVGKKQLKLATLQIVKNATNLTNLLRYNAPIVFKDYGNGGVSTARFRGTSATNTAVLWNGIPINSFGNGQTDFNSLSANTVDEILVKSGGGSVESGSGAIGGSINLNDNLEFESEQNFNLFSSYGSFETTSNFFKANYGTKKMALKFAGTLNYSTNDYDYIDKRYRASDGSLLKNENGTYKNYGVNIGLGYKFSNTNKLFFYSTGYYGDRLFSDGLPNPSSGSERNEDFNQRNLLKWTYNFNSFKQVVDVSYLTQEYRYYSNKDAKEFTFGRSKNFNFDYKLAYRISNILQFNSAFLYSKNIGETNIINDRERETFSFKGGLNFTPTDKLKTTLSFRQEYNSDFSVPFSLYVGLEQHLSKTFLLKTNFSRNYRVPTFNELYWPVVGNLDLIPENSLQGEVGVAFDHEKLKVSSTVFYIHINDKILWLPVGGSNLWRPKNVDDVVNKGLETTFNYELKVNANKQINLTGNYVYTIAKNVKTDKILPYAPKHALNFNGEYNLKWLKFYIQSLYQSKVFTNEINLDFYSLKSVLVNNLGFDFSILKKTKTSLVTGLKINNILNEVYYFTNLRPMPGRNFNISINYKF